MTILATTFFAIALARCVEEFVRFCTQFVFKLTTKKKEEKVIVQEYKRLVCTVTPKLYEEIKHICKRDGITVCQFTELSVIQKLIRDEVMKDPNG